MENRDCFLCGAVISEKSESSVRERPLKWFSDPQQFMTEHVLSNEDSVPEGSDAEMCDRCLALVVICDTLMVAFQTKVKVCQELFAEKARFSVAEPDFEKSAAEERKSVEKLTGVETKTSQKRKFQEEVSWDVTEVSAKRDSVEEIRSSVPKKQLKISTVLSGSKADSRSRQISSTKPAIAKDSSVTQSASSVIKAKVMKLKKLSSSSNDPSSPGGDKTAWVVRKVDVVATPIPAKEEHAENSADRRPAESRQSSFLEDLRFQLKSAHNKKREVHSPQEFFGSPDMRHLTVLGDSLKPQPTEPEKARNISTREIKNVSDKLAKVRSKPRLVLGAKKDPRKMTPIDVEEVSKSPLSSQSRGKRAIERRVEFEAVLDAELSRVPLENCPNEGNDALDHDYLDKPANTWKAWSMENPAYQNPRDFVIKRFKSQYRVIEVDGFEFEEYMWYMYDPYVRLTRCSHYKVAGVECKVKGAINLKENKFFYEAIFSAANHNHTASEAPPKIKNVVPRRKKPSQLDKNPNGSPIASSRNPTTKPEPELMKKSAADSDDETDKHLPKVVGFHRWPKTPAVRRLRLPQSKFFRRMCDDCGYGTKTRIVLFEHFEKLHKIDDGVRCLECGRYFARQEELDEHNELHYQEVVDKVSCITCRSIIGYPSLKTHVRMIHKGRLGRTKAERESMGVKLLACPHCPYQVLHRDDFLLHLSAFHANDELPFPCDECGERFQKSQMLVKHRSDLHPKTAREYGPLYKCKECDLKFDDRRKMNHHRLTHRPNQGKQLCPDCGEFMGPAALRDHMTLAHGHPPTRECKECGEFFPTAMKVRQHQEAAHGRPLPNSNTMRRLKVCEDCGKSYKGRTAYNFHRARQHGDELEVGHYPCTTCGIVFPTMFQRRTHYQGAHGWANNYQMQFGLECKFCDVACPEKADFKEHMKDVHGMTIAMKKIPLYVKQREKGAQLRLYKKGDIPLNPPTVF